MKPNNDLSFAPYIISSQDLEPQSDYHFCKATKLITCHFNLF